MQVFYASEAAFSLLWKQMSVVSICAHPGQISALSLHRFVKGGLIDPFLLKDRTYPVITDGTTISIAIVRKHRPLKLKCCTVNEYNELKTPAPISVQIISTVATAAKRAPWEKMHRFWISGNYKFNNWHTLVFFYKEHSLCEHWSSICQKK